MDAVPSELTPVSDFDFGPRRSWSTLLGITLDALRLSPPRYVSSIFGKPATWLPPFSRYSEFRIIDVWRLARTIKFLVNTTIPSAPVTPPTFGPPLLKNVFWQPSVILQRPDHNGNYTTFPEETWFFVNGIMTNDSVAQVNSAYLAYLFHRPVTMIWNSTDSLWIDLFECALGKEWWRVIEPAIKAFPLIYAALKDPDKRRIVVICHSEGTIIMGVVLHLLWQLVPEDLRLPWGEAAPRDLGLGMAPERQYAPPEFVFPDEEPLRRADFDELTPAELARLEVYSFANCADNMHHSALWQDRPVPYIESFGNEKDIVARLGMLAKRPEHWGIRIDGPRFVRAGAWGHLLNEHYLAPIQARQKDGRKVGGKGGSDPFSPLDGESQAPRLYSYINGGVPLA
jgi:hypothetical protein